MEKSGIEDFAQSLSKTFQNEKVRIDELERQLNQLEEKQKDLKEDLNAYNIQVLAHNNLLMMHDVQIKDWEEARIANQSARITVAEKIKQFEQKASAVNTLIMQAEDQKLVNERQINEFREQKPLTEPLKHIIDDLQGLNQLFASKKTLLEKIQKTYHDNIESLKETHQSLNEISKKLENEIRNVQKQALFKRTSDTLSGLNIDILQKEFSQVIAQIRALFSKQFWETEISIVWHSSGLYIFSSFLLFGISIFIFFRLGRLLGQFIKRPEMEKYPWGSLTLRVFRRSLFALGIFLICYIYSQILEINSGASLFHLALTLLFIWLFTKWPIDILKLWNKGDRPELTFAVRFRIRLLIDFIRYFAIAYVVIEWLISSTSIILVLGRFIFEISLLLWAASFWRLLRRRASDFFSIEYKGIRVFRSITSGILYVVVGVGFVLDLAGFGKLASYWYTSMGKTSIALMWAALLFLSLREMARKTPAAAPISDGYLTKPPSSFLRWIALRLSWVLVAFFSLFAILLAWGAKQPLMVNIFNVLNYPFHLGQMRFSLLNLFYAFLIVLLTKGVVRFWQHILRDKLLDQSGLEPGLKDSVISITVYLVWVIGILIALHAFGLNATSLAVVFGALGIGLGFGLQNIFNNFISGIILLFERPIQVGDAVEVNGLWGIVRKINVRSTQVQTYDNASLIIPNSDFISAQVTNWSFKDLRLRRTVSVGVAYGSDIHLVKKTLEEIADKIHNVLKYPKPEVLFSDFGDSALIFRLRVWTNLDYMLSVESEIRFEINRLFNEKNIEIAFPQRDLHIRTVDKEVFSGIKKN
ncbi:MAG: mechanosensitive ion channel [Desulfobacterales bacterium]